MEDEPDKLRRNTVVLSAIVLIFGYLKLSFPKELLGFGIPSGSDQKIWVLLLIVSIYSMLRYHFCGEAVAMRNDFSEQMRVQPRLKRIKLILAAARFRKYFFPIPCAYNDATSFLAQEKDKDFEFFNLRKLKALKVYNSQTSPDNASLAPLQVSFTYNSVSEGDTNYNIASWLSLTRATKITSRFHAVFSVLTSPKNVVDLFVPYAMFVAALFSLCFRLNAYG